MQARSASDGVTAINEEEGTGDKIKSSGDQINGSSCGFASR
jgi:hypothetical protein